MFQNSSIVLYTRWPTLNHAGVILKTSSYKWSIRKLATLWDCHIIFGPPIFLFPGVNISHFHAKLIFPLEILVPPFFRRKIVPGTIITSKLAHLSTRCHNIQQDEFMRWKQCARVSSQPLLIHAVRHSLVSQAQFLCTGRRIRSNC